MGSDLSFIPRGMRGVFGRQGFGEADAQRPGHAFAVRRIGVVAVAHVPLLDEQFRIAHGARRVFACRLLICGRHQPPQLARLRVIIVVEFALVVVVDRAVDGINPRDPSLAIARKAGVTCVCTGPGSANVLGGTFLAMKTVGDRIDNMIVKDPVAMKCAFGENPKRCYRDKCDSTRMSTAAFLRGALMQAKDYGARKQAANGDVTKMPAYNQKLEALLPVLAGEIPLKAHAHQANDIFTALRIAHEFGLRITLEHVTEGHLIVEELAKEKDVPMAVGPSLTHASKFELQNKSWATPGVLAKAGCHVSIITDNSVIPQQYLPLCAGMAVKAGMDEFDALKAITINPAEHIGVADRVGTLEVGKDADVVVTAGCPFEVLTETRAVFIDGNRVDTL